MTLPTYHHHTKVGHLLFAGLAGFLASGWSSGALSAQDEDPSPHSDAWLLSESLSIQPGTPFTVAVRFEMDPHWHNYWRNAGDSGLPTAIEWKLPPGFRSGEIQWPYPHRIVLQPLVDYGYSDEVVLLVELFPPDELQPGSSVRIGAEVDWLICYQICLPAYAELEIHLPVAETLELDGSLRETFSTARALLPRRLEGWRAEAEATQEGYRLTIRPDAPRALAPEGVYFYPAEAEVLDHAAPQEAALSGGALTLNLVRSPYAQGPSEILRGVVVAEEGGSWVSGESVPAMEVEATVSGILRADDSVGGSVPPSVTGPGTLAAFQEQGELTFLVALAFAFFGGILLNLMPCVFPVLSLKILSVAGQAGADRGRIRAQGLMFAVGVVLSFLALAGLLLVLRAGGTQLGWGFQLQSPYFVAFMAALFFAIGLNLLGVFEVGASFTRLGGGAGEPTGLGESLSSGILATAIATPCTAPFMGAALGFALTRSFTDTFLVFGTLGAGMALPYLILSMAPGLLKRLPRPGPWMEILKHLLAFPMFATVIWLIWVFGQQTGMDGAAHLLLALLLLSGAGWAVGRWHRTDLRSGWVARAVSLGLLVSGGFLVARGVQAQGSMDVGAEWQVFSQQRVEAHLAEGQPVFLDFTAAWCLTCQVNERLVLSSEAVQEGFRVGRVALFKADWTRQDPQITTALEGFGRSGVPLYVLYPGPPQTQPVLLPAILTEGIVLDALARHLSPGNSNP